MAVGMASSVPHRRDRAGGLAGTPDVRRLRLDGGALVLRSPRQVGLSER
jgi:hypothetical protein